MANDPSPLTVTSSLFSEGETIPTSAAHVMAGGQNISPDLAWSTPPAGTASIAVTCYDPDAPTTVGFSHWILFDLDPSTTELAAGAGADSENPPRSVLGFTDWGSSEFGGMAPPPGDPPHHYQFTVWALDTKLGGGPTTTFALLNFMMRGHVLARGRLTGLFGM
jgi:Raf kinase inhibitor-like YbhB/YbcL family protein